MLMDTEEALSDVVTPYAIRNVTDGAFCVSTLKHGNANQEGECEIGEGEIKGLAVSFADTLNMSELDAEGRKKVVSKD